MRPRLARNRHERRRAKRRQRSPRHRGVLAALGTGALALPGLGGPAFGEGPLDRWSADYSFSFYAENDVDSSKLSAGSAERYEIETQQFQIQGPVSDRMDLGIHVTHESMSGASPWFVEADPDGDPIQVMSGATIDESRTDLLVKTNRYYDSGRLGLSGGYSTENDYRALNGGLEFDRNFFESNTTLSAGAGFSLDEIEPTDAELFPTRPEEEDKQSYSLFAAISQVLNDHAAVQSSLTFQHARGYLSDPYKLVSIGGALGNVADSRPDTRNQLAWLTRYRHHFQRWNGTLHADYRFYVDDWDIHSHTLELAWYQTLWDGVRLIPSVRYYTQSQADFYAPFFNGLPADGFAASDYRLSPYGALSWKLRAETRLPTLGGRIDWSAALIWERYVSDADLALQSVDVENPGLVSYNLFMIRLRARF